MVILGLCLFLLKKFRLCRIPHRENGAQGGGEGVGMGAQGKTQSTGSFGGRRGEGERRRKIGNSISSDPRPPQKPRVAAQNVSPTPEGAIERGSIFGPGTGECMPRKRGNFESIYLKIRMSYRIEKLPDQKRGRGNHEIIEQRIILWAPCGRHGGAYPCPKGKRETFHPFPPRPQTCFSCKNSCAPPLFFFSPEARAKDFV